VPLPGDTAQLDAVRFAVFAPDGSAVLTWGLESNGWYRFEVWDWPSGKKRFAVNDVMQLKAPGFAPNGSGIHLDASGPARWDAKTGKELPLQEAWKGVERAEPLLALRPNPQWLFHEDDRGLAQVIEAGTGKPLARFRFEKVGEETWLSAHWGLAVSPTGGQYAWAWQIGNEEVELSESATCTVRRTLRGHRGEVRVLGFTPDGTKLLTASGDHTVLVWDMRLQHVPLPESLKRETNAAKLWETLATGPADTAYLAKARLAREPEAAVKLAKMKLKPAANAERESEAARVAEARAIELLEALDTEDSRALLKELASGHAEAFRTQEAKRALERNRAVTR
jgi:WD40 repeat protein